MHVIQILLPLHDNDGRAFPANLFRQVREDLTERFGGVTAFIRAPAVGFWEESPGGVNRDEVILFEVLAEQFDKDWWPCIENNYSSSSVRTKY